MKRYKRVSFLITMLFILFPLPLEAQSKEGIRKQMNQGNYSNAIILLNAMEELYPGKYASELKKARKCLKLRNSADKEYNAQHYSEAVSLYGQILDINPNDRNAKLYITRCQEKLNKLLDDEYSKCKTIDEYRLFARKYPNATQAKMALLKADDMETRYKDSIAWLIARTNDTYSSYSAYISNANPNALYLKEAYLSRARALYIIADSVNNYVNYNNAKRAYDEAINWGSKLSWDDNVNYDICDLETMFYEIGNPPFLEDIEAYLKRAIIIDPNSREASHLHLSTVYAMLIDAYCRQGRFKDARDVVKQHFEIISSSYFTKNTSQKWTKSEWNLFIKRRAKQYEANIQTALKISRRNLSNYHPNKTNKESDSIKTTPVLGVSYYSGFNNDGVYLGLRTSYSIGSLENRFNWFISIVPSFCVNPMPDETEKIVFLCPITTGPRFNINKRRGGDFFLSLSPEFGIIGSSIAYGGQMTLGYSKFGIGIEALRFNEPIYQGSSNMFIGLSTNIYL